MKRITYLAPVESMQGKFAPEADVIRSTSTGLNGIKYFMGQKRNWTVGGYTNNFATKSRISTAAPSAAQIASKQAFAAASAAVKTSWADPAVKAALRARFVQQTHYVTFWGFCFHLAYAQEPPYDNQ